MRGRTIHQRRYTYHTCRPAEAHGPRAQELWPDHPKSVAVREDYLLDGILDFFAKIIFHPSATSAWPTNWPPSTPTRCGRPGGNGPPCSAPSTTWTRGPGGWCTPWS